MKRGVRFAFFLLFVMLAGAATGCGGDEDEGEEAGATTTTEAPTECSASIGIMGPFTGEAASIGQEQLNWAKFALQRFNEENGTSLTLVEGDTQLDPAQASTVAPQFVANEDILAVVGPSASQEVSAAQPIFEEAGMAAVSPSATLTELTDGRFTTFFRVIPNDDAQGPTDAEFMTSELDVDNVLIIDDQSVYSTGLSDAVQQILEDGDIEVARESVSQDQTDYSGLASRIDDDTDVVFIPWQVAANAQLLFAQMSEQRKDAILFGGDGVFSPSDFMAEGAYVSAFAPDIRGIPEDAELVEAYTAEFGDFGTFGPPTFAATTVIMDAILEICRSGEEPTRAAVLEQVAATDSADSILGQPIRFTETGDIENARFYIFQIRDGAYELVE